MCNLAVMKKLTILLIIFTFVQACSKGSPSAPVRGNPLPEEQEKPGPPSSVKACEQCIVLAEQSRHRVAIADVPSGDIIWDWKPQNADVQPEHRDWFDSPSDAKVVYDGAYILLTASGGGVALVRIADKKTVFYAYAGGNTHSAELLPDGNIVSASSTGNHLTVFAVDTLKTPDEVYRKNIHVDFGHNVVWDHENQKLWTAVGEDSAALVSFEYNFNCAEPGLVRKETIPLPGKGSHDLFPVYGENAFWYTNSTNVYKINMDEREVVRVGTDYRSSIKSVSSGPDGFPVIMIKPKEEWWTDEVIDTGGNRIFYENGLRIYKARWVLPNSFSYPADHLFRQCD